MICKYNSANQNFLQLAAQLRVLHQKETLHQVDRQH